MCILASCGVRLSIREVFFSFVLWAYHEHETKNKSEFQTYTGIETHDLTLLFKSFFNVIIFYRYSIFMIYYFQRSENF